MRGEEKSILEVPDGGEEEHGDEDDPHVHVVVHRTVVVVENLNMRLRIEFPMSKRMSKSKKNSKIIHLLQILGHKDEVYTAETQLGLLVLF